MPKMSKYIPPHLRAAAAAGAPAPMPEPAVTQSHTEWLKEQQSRYKVVVKTPEQLRAEYDAMSFAQLKSRAGPPPPITSDDYGGVWEQGGEGEGPRVCARFDGDIRFFKQTPSRCPPPEPLGFNGRTDGDDCSGDAEDTAFHTGAAEAQKARNAYARWYSEWGKRLRAKWYEEHPEQIPKSERSAPKPKPKIRETVEERTEPSRGALAAAAEVAANSGW